MDKLRIFSGSANRQLSEEIVKLLNIELGEVDIRTFADNEIFVQVKENVRGKDVFIIQPTCNPANYNLMELLIMIDALKRSSAKRITVVLPYFGYARQDRKDRPHVPITSKLVANLIVAAGANRILTMDLHADQIQGFFDIPVDHLFAAQEFIKYFKSFKSLKNFIVVSPDAGGIARARFLATHLELGLAIIDKRRDAPNVSEVMNIIGNVKDKNVIIVDDIVDTAGTLVNGVGALKKHGANEIYTCCSHAVLSKNAYEKIENSEIKEFITTNTIPLRKSIDKIKVLSVANMFSQAIYHIHIEKSLGDLFLE